MTVSTVELVEIICGGCGVHFGMEQAYYANRKNDHKSWYCPNGCSRVYNGQTEAEKLRDQLLREQNRSARLVSIVDQATARAAEQEKLAKANAREVKRLEKRTQAGVCAQCHRHFANVESHMQSKHLGRDAAMAESKRRKKPRD